MTDVRRLDATLAGESSMAAEAMDEYVCVPDSDEEAGESDGEREREGECGASDAQERPQPPREPSRHFIRVRFEGSIPGNSLGLQLALLQSLRTLYGQAGAAEPVDILKYEPKAREALLGMSAQASTRVRNALTILTEWEHSPIRAHILESSHCLAPRVGEERPLV